MVCKYCNGTGKTQLLYSFVDCDCQKNVNTSTTMLELPSGDKVWVLNPEELDINNFKLGKAIFHRDNDLPAIEYRNGAKWWYKNGLCHRENDLPSIEFPSGGKYWYKNGLLHRDEDLPAVIRFNGREKYWFKNGLKHRHNDLPAVEFVSGEKEWWTNGVKIREE